MRIQPENIVRHELVGLDAHVTESTDSTLVSRKGQVITESKNILELKTTAGTVKIPKQTAVFDFTLPDGGVVRVNGKILQGRPEERMKQSFRRW
ncbi:MAG: ribonuclease P protein component 1 [Promethearchaeia archaeon]